MLDVGQSPVLVAGPVGIGKSTELARVALLLKQRGWVVFLVRLDRFENIRKLTAKRVWLRAAGLLVESAIRQSKLEISEGLRNLLASQGVLSEDLRAGGPGWNAAPATSRLPP
jgi:predicted ATP-dependent serine protease